MRLDPTTAAGVDSPMAATLALLDGRDPSRELLDLSQAAPPYPPAPEVVARVVEVARAPDGAAYTPVPGLPPLRRAIADDLSRDYAGSIAPADVVVTAGCNQAFGLVANALAGPGDEVIFVRYGFAVYEIAARRVGATPVIAPDDDYATDVDAILAAVTITARDGRVIYDGPWAGLWEALGAVQYPLAP